MPALKTFLERIKAVEQDNNLERPSEASIEKLDHDARRQLLQFLAACKTKTVD